MQGIDKITMKGEETWKRFRAVQACGSLHIFTVENIASVSLKIRFSAIRSMWTHADQNISLDLIQSSIFSVFWESWCVTNPKKSEPN